MSAAHEGTMKTPKISVKVSRAYGRSIYRPENEVTRWLCAQMKQSTLTEAQVNGLQKFGFDVVVKNAAA